MLNRTIRLAIIFLIIICPSCDVREREKAIEKREAELRQKEEALLMKERTIIQEEAMLKKTKQKIDSAMLVDSSRFYNIVLNGNWSAKMTCTEATCAGSAVGDTKSEQWALYYEGYTLMAQATVKNSFIRAYKGYYSDNAIELEEVSADNNASLPAQMRVRLQLIDSTTLAGQREIIRENNCRVVYALQLNKIQ